MDELVNPQQASRTITEIAHSHGFKTAAHFSRCFAEAYGCAPETSGERSETPRTARRWPRRVTVGLDGARH